MKGPNRSGTKQFSNNLRFARRLWPNRIHGIESKGLEALSRRYLLSVGDGELIFLDGRWYVTHAGLLRIAQLTGCAGIRVEPLREFCDPSVNRWVFKATVYKSPRSRGFVGYGDADPSNVSFLVHGAEMRVAETRAVNRALRKAYGIGLCSVEELGWSPRSSAADRLPQNAPPANGNNGHRNGQPRLRDRLCLLIRRYSLDANLVKAYAADYCGTATLRDATRDQIEEFIAHLAERAVKDRDGLLCHLNSYPKPEEVTK